MKVFYFILPFYLTIISNCQAQVDTEFWFAAPEVSSGHGDRPIFIRISTLDQAASVQILQPARSFQAISVTIPPNTTYTIEVSKKKFVTKDQTGALKGQISTVGQETSQQYYKVFKLREVTDKFVFHMPLVLYAYDKSDLMIDATGSAKGNDSKRP